MLLHSPLRGAAGLSGAGSPYIARSPAPRHHAGLLAGPATREPGRIPPRYPEAGSMQDPPEIATQSSDRRSCGSVRVKGGAPEMKNASPALKPSARPIRPLTVIG